MRQTTPTVKRNSKNSLIAKKPIRNQDKFNRNLFLNAKANEILYRSNDFKSTLNNLAKLCVKELADWCVVDMLENGEVNLFAVSHKEPKMIAWAKKLRRTNKPDLDSNQGVSKVLKTGISEFVPQITDQMLVHSAKSPDQLKLLRLLKLKSAMIVPIKSPAKTFGAISFISTNPNNLYTQEDLMFAEELGIKASQVIQKARLNDDLNISRDNLDIILRNVAEGISVQDPSGKLLFANDAAAKICGFTSAEEMIQTPIEKIITRFAIYDEYDTPLMPSDLPGRLALAGRASAKIVKFKILASGEERFSEVSATPVLDEKKKVKFAINVFRDITENKRSEAALKASEERWRSVVQNAPDFIFNVDRKHNIQFINKLAPGLSLEQVLGTSIYNFIPKNYHQIAKKALNNTFRTGRSSTYEIEGIGANGQISWYRSRTGPIKDQWGKVVALTVISSDITDFKTAQELIQQSQRNLEKKVFERTRELQKNIENLKKEIKKRKQVEQELVREKAFTEKLINTNLVGVLAFDKHCRYTVWNPGMEAISGLKASKVIGKSAFSVFSFLKKTGESKNFFSALEGKHTVSRDQKYNIPQTGKQGFFDAYYSPIYNDKNKVEGGLAFLRDVTERKQIEEAKFNALKELERAKSEFVSLASHELRTPLTIINGYFDLLVSGDLGNFEETSSNFQIYIDKMYRETRRLSKLVEDLLNTSRIQDGRIKLNFEKINLNEVVSEVVGEFKPIAKNKGISLTSTNKLNGLTNVTTVLADRDKLKQIIMNLVDNAITYNKPDGKVNIKIFSRGEKIFIEVKDTGVGIDQHLLPRIFDKFQQAHGTYLKENKGTGLGLFIVKSLVELQNGNIEVKSSVGEGTSFIVDLPLKVNRKQTKLLH